MADHRDDPAPAFAGDAVARVDTAVCGLRQRKKQQTREALIDCAVDLFEQQGYDTTTIEEIAAAANVSPRTFFRYFDSKMELIRAPKPDHDTLEELVGARPASEGPVTAIHRVIGEMVGRELLGDDRSVRLMRVMLTTPSLRAAAMEHFQEHQAELARACARRLGVGEDELRPQVVAAAVGTTIWTVVDRWVDQGAATESLMPMLDDAFALLRAGME
jgi:hypothetical protein